VSLNFQSVRVPQQLVARELCSFPIHQITHIRLVIVEDTSQLFLREVVALGNPEDGSNKGMLKRGLAFWEPSPVGLLSIRGLATSLPNLIIGIVE
jgi:hypothetical protein